MPDASVAAIDRRPLLVLAALALLVKVPTLGTPAFWDEMAWRSQAGWLADNGLFRVLPGLRPDAQFFGHTPGLHFAAAALFTVFGRSIVVAHVLIACLGAIGVLGTYALLRAAYDAKTALLAASLLLFSPAWGSSAGLFLADLPAAALGVLCAVFVARGRALAFFIAASCSVLIKETAVGLVVALIAFRVLTRLPLIRAAFNDALPYAAPLLVFGAFIILEARRRRELLLFALVALASGYVFSVHFYLPRYMLPVLAFFYALGAVSLMAQARTPARAHGVNVITIYLRPDST